MKLGKIGRTWSMALVLSALTLLLPSAEVLAEDSPKQPFPEAGFFSHDPTNGLLLLRVPEAKVDRRFFAWIRTTFEDGSETFSSLGCFPLPCPKGTSPIGSSVILDAATKGKIATAVELIWLNDPAKAPSSIYDNEFRRLVAAGAKVLKLRPS